MILLCLLVACAVGPTDAPDCAALAREVAAELFGGRLRPVLEHSVPLPRASADGARCFLTFHHDVKAPQLAPGQAFPYPYVFVLANGAGLRTVIDLADEPVLTLAAVGFEDVDEDGDDDVLLVHEEGRGFVFVLGGGADSAGWMFHEPEGGAFGAVADLLAWYRGSSRAAPPPAPSPR